MHFPFGINKVIHTRIQLIDNDLLRTQAAICTHTLLHVTPLQCVPDLFFTVLVEGVQIKPGTQRLV